MLGLLQIGDSVIDASDGEVLKKNRCNIHAEIDDDGNLSRGAVDESDKKRA